MSVWTYKVLTAKEMGLESGSKPNDLLVQLNQLGSDGWELAAVIPIETPDSKDFWLVFRQQWV